LIYSEPFHVNSRFKFFSNINRIISLLVGRHTQSNAVFGRLNGYPSAGSFHVNDMAPIKKYLTENDCAKNFNAKELNLEKYY
jgi:hypothetical protein